MPRAPPNTLAVVANDQAANAAAGKAAEERALRRGPCGIPIAVSSEALMVPGGIRRIQEQLVKKHLLARPYRPGQLDAPTLEALRRFQQLAQFPAVGLPSYATVEALGISPKQIFRSGDPNCEKGT